MSGHWLKMIGTSEGPLPKYESRFVGLAKKPRHMEPGDPMVLYAVGGEKKVFALAQVASEVYEVGNGRWPYRVDIEYEDNLPASSGVSIDEVSTSARDLRLSVRQNSYIELSPEEYERAATKLRGAFAEKNRSEGEKG